MSLSLFLSLSLCLPNTTTPASFKLQKPSFSEQQAALWCSHPINKAQAQLTSWEWASEPREGRAHWLEKLISPLLSGVSLHCSQPWCGGHWHWFILGGGPLGSPAKAALSQLAWEPTFESLVCWEDQGGTGSLSTHYILQPESFRTDISILLVGGSQGFFVLWFRRRSKELAKLGMGHEPPEGGMSGCH